MVHLYKVEKAGKTKLPSLGATLGRKESDYHKSQGRAYSSEGVEVYFIRRAFCSAENCLFNDLNVGYKAYAL